MLFWSKCKVTLLVVVSGWVGLRFYCFMGVEVFLLETVNSSQAPWIYFPKFSLDAHCIARIFQTSKSSFRAYAWDHSRKSCAYSQQKPTPCPLPSQGVNPNQQNMQRLKSAMIYSVWLVEMVLSHSCARLRSDGYFLPQEPPWRMGAVLELLQNPPNLHFLSVRHECGCCLKHGAGQLPATPWVQRRDLLRPGFTHGSCKHSGCSSPGREPGITLRARQRWGFNFETTCTQPVFPHTNLSSSQSWKLETSFVFQRPKGQTCL